jgi:phage-related tail fiber protein
MATQKRFVARNGLDSNSQTITSVADPVNAQDASTKNFSSNASNLTVGTLAAARLPAHTGDVTSSAGSAALTLANSGVSAGTFRSVTVDLKGRVTAGTNPTTLTGYGITDALPIGGGTLTGPLQINNASLVSGSASAATLFYTGASSLYGLTMKSTTAGATTAINFFNSAGTNVGSIAHNDATLTFNGNATSASAIAWSGVTGKPTTLSGYGITDAALIASPTFTGVPAAPTASAGTNTTQIATTAFVSAAVANLISSAPTALDTLNELAAALGDDANFSTTVTNSLSLKAPIASPTFTGVPAAPTASNGTNTTQIATTAFVAAAVAAGTGGNVASATVLQTARTIALTGDVTYTSGAFNGSANVTGVATLANSGVTAGTYPKVTVDAKGRVTAGSALASGDLPTYTGTLSSSQITTGLGFTPYNSTNPSGFITSAGNAATASSSPLLSALGNYAWTAASLPTSFAQGIQCSFVSSAQGFQEYGSLMTMNTYSGGGGALQLYVPYGTSNGGVSLQARFGNYNVNNGKSWTSWKTLLASDNFSSYAPTLTGTGASGTWGINVTGSAGSVAWSGVSSKPTTLAGYGISDAAASSHVHTFASLTSKPTTLAGYGITDAALLASPTFTGVPTAPTATAGTNTTQIATTAFVQAYDDAAKANLASPTFTGVPAAPTAAAATNTTQIATTAFVQAHDDATKANLASSNVWTATQAPANGSLTDAATIAWNGATMQVASVTVAGNRTLGAITGIVSEASYVLIVSQDATGGRTLAWNSVYKFAGGTVPTLSTGANAVDVFTFVANAAGTALLCIGQVKDIK